MEHAGIPVAGILVYMALLAELLGGIAILTGFLTRLAAPYPPDRHHLAG
jgi:uncharacterized membrane protein YphA (DoxX/SURF4 family)